MMVRHAVVAHDLRQFRIALVAWTRATSSAMYWANAGCAAILRQVRMPKISACMS